jgi:hypothetical protein
MDGRGTGSEWQEREMTTLRQQALITNHGLSPKLKTGLAVILILLLALLVTVFLLAAIAVG